MNSNTLNLNKMKNNYLKLGMIAVLMLSVSIGYAQQATGDIAQKTAIVYGTTETGGAIRVIDNKGTIKYLQADNGITTLTNTTADVTTTTWQLGGTLLNDTDIDFNGTVFSFSSVLQAAAADAATLVDDSETGKWTLLTRDEDTGEIKKLLATDLISGIRVEYDQSGDAAADVAIPVAGLPLLTALTTEAKLFVYRNGVKLRTGTDFVATPDTVTITYDATDLPMFDGDIIEIQYIK